MFGITDETSDIVSNLQNLSLDCPENKLRYDDADESLVHLLIKEKIRNKILSFIKSTLNSLRQDVDEMFASLRLVILDVFFTLRKD